MVRPGDRPRTGPPRGGLATRRHGVADPEEGHDRSPGERQDDALDEVDGVVSGLHPGDETGRAGRREHGETAKRDRRGQTQPVRAERQAAVAHTADRGDVQEQPQVRRQRADNPEGRGQGGAQDRGAPVGATVGGDRRGRVDHRQDPADQAELAERDHEHQSAHHDHGRLKDAGHVPWRDRPGERAATSGDDRAPERRHRHHRDGQHRGDPQPLAPVARDLGQRQR